MSEQAFERIDSLIEKASTVLATREPVISRPRYSPPQVSGEVIGDTRLAVGWRSQALTFLDDFVGENSNYAKEFRSTTEDYFRPNSVERGVGILLALKEDIERGYLRTYRQLIAADLFSDFFEQAEHLFQNGYHQPAASLAGAALENGLKEIARDRGIALAGREDLSTLSGKMADKEIINRLEQKQLSVMADVRNAADHGEFDRFDADDVSKLIRDASDFLAKHAT